MRTNEVDNAGVEGMFCAYLSYIMTEVSQNLSMKTTPHSSVKRLLATARPRNKLPIRVLTPTDPSLRILDTSSSLAFTLSISIPKEGPVIAINTQLCIRRRSTSVSHTSTIGSSMIGIVLVINLEHSKSLRLGGSGVVTAFGGLDGFAGLCGTARW